MFVVVELTDVKSTIELYPRLANGSINKVVCYPNQPPTNNTDISSENTTKRFYFIN